MAEDKVAENMQDLFVVDDGFREIPVWNTLHEQIGTLRYNPTDLNIVNRYREIAGKFEKITKIAGQANISPEGVGEDRESIDILNEAEKELTEALDYLLQSDSKRAFFSVVNPFTPIDGVFYCENVMDQLRTFITRVFDAELEKVNARVSRQTHGYRTGKHRKGDR